MVVEEKKERLSQKNPQEITLFDLYRGLQNVQISILELRSTTLQAILTAIAIVIGVLAL